MWIITAQSLSQVLVIVLEGCKTHQLEVCLIRKELQTLPEAVFWKKGVSFP